MNEILCPYCRNAMTRGFVYARGGEGVFFFPKNETPPTFLTRRAVEKTDGIVLDGPYVFRFNETQIEADVCRACKKIVMELE